MPIASKPAPPLPHPIVTCACGRAYRLPAWRALPLVGRMADGLGGELELRNCPCGSTRAIELAPLAKCASPRPPRPAKPPTMAWGAYLLSDLSDALEVAS